MYIMCHILKCSVYFDYIDSNSNDSDSSFSDGISRALRNDAWATKHAISTKVMQPETSWWTADMQKLWSLLERGGKEKGVLVQQLVVQGLVCCFLRALIIELWGG